MIVKYLVNFHQKIESLPSQTSYIFTIFTKSAYFRQSHTLSVGLCLSPSTLRPANQTWRYFYTSHLAIIFLKVFYSPAMPLSYVLFRVFSSVI
jgi:hypothetical protein